MKLRDIADRLGCRLAGDGDLEIIGLADMENAGPGQLTFFANSTHRPSVKHTQASAILVAEPIPEIETAFLISKNPSQDFARAQALYPQSPKPTPGIHPLAYVAPSAVIGENCSIGPFAVVGERVKLGRNAVLHPHVVLYEGAEIGDDFVAHSHATVREFCRVGDRVTLENGEVLSGAGKGKPSATIDRLVSSLPALPVDEWKRAVAALQKAPPFWWRLALAAVLTVYFLLFNWGSLRCHFAPDDLSNIGHYFEYSPWQVFLSNLMPWRGDSRPMGGLFYIPIYHFAGLNPLPYQAVLLAILLANVYLAYKLARLLGAGELPAWLVALACCYHGGIANLYYNAAFVFDALCCCFYLAALIYYLKIRNRERLLGPGQTVAFLAIFLCALNSKEMAVSVPVMLLVYEWIYHQPAKWNSASLLAWVRGPARVAWMAGVLTAVDIYPKLTGSTTMIAGEAYRPVFSLERLLAFQVTLFQDLFFSWNWTPGWGQTVGTFALLAYLAWRRSDRPVLRFLFWFLVVAPLPIEFLKGRGQACFVLLMVGGAIFLAVVFVDAVNWAARSLAREFKLPPAGRKLLAGAMVAAAVLMWVSDQRHLREQMGKDPMTLQGVENWDIVQQLRASSFHPRNGASVAFLDDPFRSLDMYFIARLWFHDRSDTVHVMSQGPLTPQELAKIDYVFTFENRKLIRLK